MFCGTICSVVVVFITLGVFEIKSAGNSVLRCDAVFMVTAMRASPLCYFSALNLIIRLYCWHECFVALRDKGLVRNSPHPLLRRPYFGSNFCAFFERRALHVCMPTQTSNSEITILGIIRLYLEFGWGEKGSTLQVTNRIITQTCHL